MNRYYSSICKIKRNTIFTLQRYKDNNIKIPMITCYDYTSSKLISNTDIPVI